MNPIDILFEQCFDLCGNVPFVEFYSHEDTECWKIFNSFTKYGGEKIVLCKFSGGVENALTIAISEITKRKDSWIRGD